MKTHPKALIAKFAHRRRNDLFFDTWSIVHFATGILFGLLLPWLPALILLAAWEPLENFVLSPLLARFGINFGFESWRNSLSDIFFDAAGIAIGHFIVLAVAFT